MENNLNKKNSFCIKVIIILVIIFLLFLPAGINLCYLEPAVNEIFEEPKKWTEFWGTYISALASFAMVAMTWKTLRQNKEQLDELKRQWNEQNTPKVFCSLERTNKDVVLLFQNISNSTVANVSVAINSNIEKNGLFQKKINSLNNTHFIIPPLSKKIINLYIPAYCDGEYEGQYIEVTITTNNIVQGTYRMCLSEINLIRSLDYSPISDELENLNSTIKNKKIL